MSDILTSLWAAALGGDLASPTSRVASLLSRSQPQDFRQSDLLEEWATTSAALNELLDRNVIEAKFVHPQVFSGVTFTPEWVAAGLRLMELAAPLEAKLAAQEAADFDLVLLHGWGGRKTGSWGEFPFFIADALGQRIGALLPIGYPTYSLFRGRIPRIQPSLKQLVDVVETSLYSKVTRPFVAVTHSLGGIIMRAIAERSHRGIGRLPAESIKGLILLSPPLAGSWFALAWAPLTMNRHLWDIRANSPVLRRINRYWRNRRLADLIPSAIVAGEGDMIVRSQKIETIALEEGSQYYDLPRLAHMNIAQREETAELVATYIDSRIAL